MRSLDNWTTYEDTWGKPFQGKFTFYKLGTSQLITITDVDGTPLSNPMISDMYGRTAQQVFLPDIDVTVVMHKWIGPEGSMSEADTDDNHWTFVRSFDNLTEVTQGVIDGQLVDAIRVKTTYNDLNTVQIPEGVQYAIVCGYYELGDMPPVYYKLMVDDTLTPDGGSVIRSDSDPSITNRYWVLIPNQVIDCRVFGVFPRNVPNNPTAWSSQLGHCFFYANNMGRDVYMPQVYSNTINYYWLEGGTFELGTSLIIDKNVKICVKQGTVNTMRLYNIKHDGGLYIFYGSGGNSTLTLNVNGTMRASWFNPSWAVFPGTVEKVILDTRSNPFTFRNTIVEVEQLQSNKTFTFEDCYIESDHKFRNCTLNFTRCGYVSDKWMDSGNTITLIDNRIELSNMSSANAYIDWKNKQREYDYGDLGEQEIDATVSAGGTIDNCSGKITISGQSGHGAFEFHNVSLQIIGLTATDSINAVDSWLSIPSNSVVDSLAIRRGSLSGSNIQVLTSLYFEGIEDYVALTTLGATAEIRNSKIAGNITATDIVLVSNQIRSVIDQRDNNGVLSGAVMGNIFEAGGQHYIHSYTADSRVDIVWKDNHMAYKASTPENYFIQMDRTNFLTDDRHHNYVWESNDPIPVIKNTMGAVYGPSEAITQNCVRAYNNGSESGSFGYCDFNHNYVTASGITYSQWGLQIAFFRVGLYPRRDSILNIKPWDRGKYTDPDYPMLPYTNPYYRYIEKDIPLIFHDSGASTYTTSFLFGVDINTTYRMVFTGMFMHGIVNRIINNRPIYEIPEALAGQNLEDCTFNIFGEVSYV